MSTAQQTEQAPLTGSGAWGAYLAEAQRAYTLLEQAANLLEDLRAAAGNVSPARLEAITGALDHVWEAQQAL